MKKILIFMAILFLSISVNVKADSSSVRVSVYYVPDVYYNYKKDGVIYWGQLGYIRADKQLAYCLDILTNITTDTYFKGEISNDIKEDMILTSYFGFEYGKIGGFAYYAAAQQMIWKQMGIDVYFTDQSMGKGNIIDLSDIISIIEERINEYKRVPEIGNNFKVEIGSTLKLDDLNEVLNNFNVINNSENDISINNNNKVIIKAIKKGKGEFELRTQYKMIRSNLFLSAPGSQDLLVAGSIPDISRTYSYEVIPGSISIDLFDSKTRSKENTGLTSFKGNVFEIYKDDEFVKEVETDETGRIYIDDLDLGSYKLKHVIVSEGYIKNKEVYNFEIVNGNINIKESIYLEPLKSNITINKTYGNPIVGTSFYDKNVSFLIRNSKGDDVATIVTDEMGKANITLDYDNYRIMQITNNGIGNEYMREFRLNKSMFNRNHVYNIFTPIYEAKLKVKVYDLSTKLPMENIEFEIDGKTYFTDGDGIFITDNYKEGVYTLCETQIDGYYAIDDIIVEINDNSSYYIENDEIFIDVIVYNEKIKKEIENEEKDIIDDNNDKEEINDKIENKDGEELIDKPNKIEKLPDLGIINHVNYLIFFLLGYKRVKKNNC